MVKNRLVKKIVHGWEGEGSTVTFARQEAIHKIEKAGYGSFMPTVLHHKGVVGVVFREREGYSYTVVKPTKSYSSVFYGDNEQEAVNSMIYHVAQYGFTPGDSTEPPEFMTGQSKRDEFRRWATWQNEYKMVKDKDPALTDDQVRNILRDRDC